MILHICTKLNDHPFIVLVFYVWLSCSICHATSGMDVVQGVMKERDALLHFKNGITKDHCGLLDSWGATLDCCQWAGISCNNHTGHVTMLSLPGKGFVPGKIFLPCIEGIVNVSLAELTHLKHLDLSNNNFNYQAMPKFIGSISNLEYLNLSNAGFDKGIIPHEFGNLSRLSSLDLNCEYSDINMGFLWVESLSWVSHLRLLREINLGGVALSKATNWMSVINNLPLLEVLRMDSSNLPSILPSSLSYINTSNSLHVISLSGNYFSGSSIFQWLSNISRTATSLSYLDLHWNSFSGQIPSFIGKINSLSHLDLSLNSFSGRIPSSIGKINSLSHLDLSDNQFSGPIPSEIWTTTSNLSYLDLSSNHLEGPLNNTISNLKYLTLLRLAINQLQLSRQFVKSLAKLCQLHTLTLDNNTITSEFSEVIDSLSQCAHKSLVYLTLSNTQLRGSIPTSISTFSRLEELDLSSNYLNGVVSHNHFSNLSSLQGLTLSYNHGLTVNLSVVWTPPFQLVVLGLSSCMIGPKFPKWLVTQLNIRNLDISNAGIIDVIPESFLSSMAFESFELLNISNNMIHGVLPNLFIAKSLLSLDLSSNNFSGAMPDCWGNVPSLYILKLQNNNISGNLPPSIATMQSLQVLHLGNNSLRGELHRSWINSPALMILDLSYNSMVGSIPPTFGLSLPNLRILSLKNNKFSKGIPSSICQLTFLQILDLSSNQLSGPLPNCLYSLTMMVNNTNFPQPMPLFIMNYILVDSTWLMWERNEQRFNVLRGLVKGIDISDNNLQGPIPDQISTLAGLVSLNLSQNNLTGAIPSGIGQLTSLQSLDLSRNHLSGKIPTSLASISFLAVLDLSNNSLSGMIPSGTQLQGFNASANTGNPGLCGEPLPACDVPQKGDNIAQHKDADNDYIFIVGLIISVVAGLITGFWAVCGTLVLKRNWRHAYFRYCEDIADWFYVRVVVYGTRLRRRFSS